MRISDMEERRGGSKRLPERHRRDEAQAGDNDSRGLEEIYTPPPDDGIADASSASEAAMSQ
jgi:hypothetical protein